MVHQEQDPQAQIDLLAQRLGVAQTELTRRGHLIEKFRRLAYTDPLTGVANRRAFNKRVPGLIEIALREKQPLAILLTDVDGLKRANDSLGRKFGDEIIMTVARTLQDRALDVDFVARLTHGDEFAKVMPNFYTNTSLVRYVCVDEVTAINSAISDIEGLPPELYVGASVGIATLDLSGDSMSSLFSRANSSLDASKISRREALAGQGVFFQGDQRLLHVGRTSLFETLLHPIRKGRVS